MESDNFFVFHDPSPGCCYNTTLAEMRREGELCDVEIRAENQSFQAHRSVLAAASPVFRAMFRDGFAESTKKEITLECVDSQSLESIIDFVYWNRLKITKANVLALLDTAVYLDIMPVTCACFKFLLQIIDTCNVFTIRDYAKSANETYALEKADRFVRENFEDVSKCEEFIDLSIDELKSFICRDDLFVITEQTVFDAVIRWVRASEEKRLDFLPELLKYVRMTLLSPELLESRVFGELHVRVPPVCESMLSGTYKCQAVEKSVMLYDMTMRERFCKNKHHIKCLKVAGCGFYSFCTDEHLYLFRGIKYYDSINKKWVALNKGSKPGLCSPKHVVCAEEGLYFIGSTDITKLDLGTLEHTYVKCDGEIDSKAGIAYHSNTVYLFGGSHNRANRVQTVDLRTGARKVVGSLVVARQYAATVSLEKFIFIIGGKEPSRLKLKSVEKFSPETRKSTEVAPMLRSRSECSCVPVQGKIFVAGGEIENYLRSFSDNCSVEVYDPLTDQWNYVKEMNGIKDRVCLIPYDGKLLALHNNWTSRCFHGKSYDPEKDEWEVENAFSDLEFCQIHFAVFTNSAISRPYYRGEETDSDSNEDLE